MKHLLISSRPLLIARHDQARADRAAHDLHVELDRRHGRRRLVSIIIVAAVFAAGAAGFVIALAKFLG